MKTKLSSSAIAWTHLVLGLLIAAETAFLFWGMRWVMPGCKRIMNLADTDAGHFYAFVPGSRTLLGLLHIPAYNPIWWIVGFAAIWGLFEWRVSSERKSRLRLNIMASMGLVLFLISGFFAAAMVIPVARAAEQMNTRDPAPIVAARLESLDRLLAQLQLAVEKNDLPTADGIAHTAGGAANDLALTGASASTLMTSMAQPRVDQLRADLDLMAFSMRETWMAAKRRHAEQIQEPLQKFCEAYARVKSETTSTAK